MKQIHPNAQGGSRLYHKVKNGKGNLIGMQFSKVECSVIVIIPKFMRNSHLLYNNTTSEFLALKEP